MNKKYLTSVIAGICLSYSHAVHADMDAYLSMSLEQLMDVEVNIATSTKQIRREAPSVVSVITAENIKNSGAVNLGEVLESVPGLHIWTNQFAARPQPHFRGTNGTQTLLMVDGNSMRDLVWTFGFFWKGMPVEAIERIEIIRGPGSALFGADASAGVINVITKAASGVTDSEVGVRAGSFDSYSAWAQQGVKAGKYDVSMTVNASSTDGHSPFITADRNGNSGDANYGWNNVDFRFSVARDEWRVLLGYVDSSDIGIGLTGAAVLDPRTEASERRLNLDWLYDKPDLSADWGMHAALRFQDYSYSSENGFYEQAPGYFDGTNTYIDGQINHQNSSERRLGLELFFDYQGFDDHNLKLGLGQQWHDLYETEQTVNFGTDRNGVAIAANTGFYSLTDSPSVFAPEETREVSWLLAQDIWAISDKLELTAGLRYDHYSDFGNTVNPRLALVWKTTDKLTAKLLYGEAFKPPSFLQLYSNTSFSTGNTSLQSEESETWDLVLSYRPVSNLQLDAGVFYLNIDDLIVRNRSTTQYENAATQTINGIELEMNWRPVEQFNISANYTYRNAIDDTALHVSQPEQEAFASVDWDISRKTHWNLQGNWIGERPVNAGSTIDDYIAVDTTLRHHYDRHWEVAASIRNLFDEDAREYSSVTDFLALPERNAYVELRYHFD
jgi:outer membrane cobalamin receptor